MTGYIVGPVNQEDQIILRIQIGLDHLVIEGVHHVLILQLRIPQGKQLLLTASGNLFLQRKFQVQQVFSHGAGKRFLQDIGIFKHFLLRKGEEGFFHGGYFFLVAVHIASADAVYVAVVFLQLFLDFKYFFFIHFFRNSCKYR